MQSDQGDKDQTGHLEEHTKQQELEMRGPLTAMENSSEHMRARDQGESKYDPKHKEFWKKVQLPGGADDSYIYIGKGIELHQAQEDGTSQRDRPRLTTS